MKKTITGRFIAFFILGILVLILMAVLNGSSYGKVVRDKFYLVSSPFLRTFSGLASGMSSFWQKLNQIEDIYNKNVTLENENIDLRSEISKLKEAEIENESMRQLLQFDQRKEYKVTMSNIISKKTDALGQYVTIDKGESAGIRTDDAVIIGNGILVGKITEVSPNFSKIKLIISADSAVAAVVQESRSSGVIKGQYNLSLLMDMINSTDTIEVGNQIVTSGQDNVFPKGLLIGTVNQVNVIPGYIFKTANILPIANFDKLETVFILSKK